MKRNKKILFMPFFMLFNDSLLMKIETFFAGLLMIYLIFYYYVDDSGQFFFFFFACWFHDTVLLFLTDLTSPSSSSFLHLFHGRVSYVPHTILLKYSIFQLLFGNAIKLCEEVIKIETPQLSFFSARREIKFYLF